MIYGYAWDTSSTLSFAISILPILGIGLTVTLKAAATGFAIALVLGLVFALCAAAHTKSYPGRPWSLWSFCAIRRCWCNCFSCTTCCLSMALFCPHS